MFRSAIARRFVLLLVPVLSLVLVPLALGRSTPLTPAATVARAWELAEESGSYRFQTLIAQQATLQPSLHSAGRGASHAYLSLRGTLDQPANRLELQIWQSNDPEPTNAAEVRVVGQEATGRVGSGPWQPITFDTASFAPGGDPLGFLAGARDIQRAKTEQRSLGTVTETYTGYTFTLDGAAFAAHMQQRIEPQLRTQNTLPGWMNRDLISTYKDLSGSGTLWLDADGLPARLQLDLSVPTPKSGEKAMSTVQTDYSRFDRQRLAVASTPFWANPGGWLSFHLQALLAAAPALPELAAKLLLVVVTCVLLLATRRVWQTRRFYATVTSLILTGMLVGPLAQARMITTVAAAQSTVQATSAAAIAAGQARADGLAALHAPTMDPHQPPQRPVVPKPSSPAPLTTTSTTDSDIDSDGDGLSDDDEATWGTCARTLSTGRGCSGVKDSQDSDADGVSDGLEVHQIGTLPGSWDTDKDLISDTLEIKGFRSTNKTWYLNPAAVDSNMDGLTDSQECTVFLLGSSDYNASGSCPDTDTDGTPDVWDDDNDNDGVLDAYDADPGSSSGSYSSAAPLQLTVNGLHYQYPTFVDFQLRPTDVKHLEYMDTVLDWPSGDDQGQIQRHLDTTFQTTSNATIQSNDPNADNGDVRLVPMLEISVPFQQYPILPVKAAYRGRAITTATPLADWLDTDTLAYFGITVNADDTAGDLLVYVPLSPVLDTVGGARQAFAARMVYWPTAQTTGTVAWGSAQQVRLLWMVQMITDECSDSTTLSTCANSLQVIHVYDDTWKLTGLDVREDRGVGVNIIYEDPTKNNKRPTMDDLWAASWNLGNQWLRGRDCDSLVSTTCVGNQRRDVTLTNMASTLHSWSSNDDDLAIATHPYTDVGHLAQLSTDTERLLNAVYVAPYATSPVTETSLLFAREDTYRVSGLSAATVSGTSISVPMDTTTAPVVVQALLNWSRYAYDSVGGWREADAEADLNRLEAELATDSAFADTDDSAGTNSKIVLMQAYYSSLLTCLGTIVESANALTWSAAVDEDITEISYESSWPSATFTGASYTLFAMKDVLSVALTTSGDSIMTTFLNPTTTSSFAKLSGAKFYSGTLMTATIGATVAGLALFAAGYFSGNTTYLNIAVKILLVTTVVTSVAWATNIVAGVVRAAGGIKNITWSLIGKVSSANRAVGKIGLGIGLLVAAGLFVYSAFSAGVLFKPNSIAFNTFLANAIASTILTVMLFLLDLIPGGGVLISILYAVDALMYLICRCKGVQDTVTQAIAKSLYGTYTLISNFNSPSRLDYDFKDVTFGSSEMGFIPGNTVRYSMQVTDTIHFSGYGDGFGDAKELTLRYWLETDDAAHDDDIAQGEMSSAWHKISDGSSGLFTASTGMMSTTQLVTQTTKIFFNMLQSGINRSLSGTLYLNEGVVVPYLACWRFFDTSLTLDHTCTVHSYEDTLHYNVGQSLYFDILPTTLNSFHDLDWNHSSATIRFPGQSDQDGDGLASSIDPNSSTWDADGDGLSDAEELVNGTSATIADTDGDGMTDRLELMRGLNPLAADSDEDGLSDQQEWTGWRTSYTDTSGQVQYFWVWSDPYRADADEDGLTDLQEFYYGYNPNVATDSDELLKTITFADGGISEQAAPKLLLRFEEAADARLFRDTSGHGRLLTCDPTTGACPAAATLGRYGSAATFDGSAALTVPDESDFNLSAVTVSAWIRVAAFTAESQVIVAKGSSWSLGRYGTTNQVAFTTDDADLVSTTTLNDNQWHHLVGVASSVGTYLYLDGALNASASGKTLSVNTQPVTVGGAAVGGREFAGDLDEVAIYGVALSAAQVQRLTMGKYNADDATVNPGDTLAAALTVTNNSSNYPAAVTYYGQVELVVHWLQRCDAQRPLEI